MIGVAVNLGGRPRIPTEMHKLRGSYRPDRDPELVAERDDVSKADRARVLAGLPPAAKQMTAALLDTFTDWNAAMLFELRVFAWSCDRVAKLQEARTVNVTRLHAELRIHIALLEALGLNLPRPEPDDAS
jgi:hypothetical protein